MSQNRYEKVKRLGKGSFGTAWLVVSKQSGRNYVIKEMDLEPNLSQKVRSEQTKSKQITANSDHWRMRQRVRLRILLSEVKSRQGH